MPNIYGNSQAMLYPGIAYHFSRRNLLDVYVGAELPLGWSSDRSILESGDMTSRTTKSAFVIGLGAFIGLQAYIADCMGINHERGEGSYELLGAALKSRTIDIGDAVYGEQILARLASGLNDPDIGGLGDILAESGDELRALINGVNLRAERAK